ncbi:MAG: PAS domain-containing protein [Calditrichaeota bacterium]|nr:MAG: PAS domain-containing protein [Calditrichota bacterium]
MLILPPRVLLILSVVLLFVIFSTAFYELSRQKIEIEHLMHEEGSLLIESLSLGAENAIVSYNEIKDQLAERLLNNLRMLDRLDARKPLTREKLFEIAASNHLYRINLFDRNGNKTASSHPEMHEDLVPLYEPIDLLWPIISNAVDSLVFGFQRSRFDQGLRFAVAIKRSRGGAITTNVDAKELVELRRRIGVGRLIQRIGASVDGIAYIVWQDTSAIISATENVIEMDALHDDPFLYSALEKDSVSARLTHFENKGVFEVVKPFSYQGTIVGLMRIGLWSDHADTSLARIRQRFFMLLGLLFFGTVIFLNLFMARRNELSMTRAFQREQKFTGTILQSLADAVLAVDTSGRITLVNDAAVGLFKLPAGSLTGKKAVDLLPFCTTFLSRVLHNKQQEIIEEELSCAMKGQQLILAATSSLLHEDNGELGGAVIVFRDLTDRRALEKVVLRQEKLSAMGKLASGVAHEIRNPLNAIGMLGQRLGFEFTPRESESEYKQLVKTIVSEVRRVNDIIQRFLKFARPPKLNKTKVNFNEFIRENETLLQSEAARHKIKLAFKLAASAALEIDKDQMIQVLLNLVRNAVDASTVESRIVVKTYNQGSFVVFDIQDFGSGLDDEEISKIFDLYYTTKNDGTGMGLSIANQIVQAHGGMIEVESSLGKGSVFRIVLPIVST